MNQVDESLQRTVIQQLAEAGIASKEAMARYGLSDSSEYEKAANKALSQVCATLSAALADKPVGGFMSWLESTHTLLARRIQALNDRLDWEWGQRVPMEQFQATLKVWTEAHGAAAALYRKERQL